MIYAFGEYELDTQRYELRHAGTPCALEPQGFNVLVYLVQHRHRVVTKAELLDQLWPNQYVSEGALSQRIMAARRVLGDNGRTQGVIKTVRGRGYRFVAAVVERPHEEGQPDDAGPVSHAAVRHCPVCQQEHDGTALFCPACGALLTYVCPNCRQSVRMPAAFCPTCGHRREEGLLSADPRADGVEPPHAMPGGERKLVTVLSAGLVRHLKALLLYVVFVSRNPRFFASVQKSLH